MKPLNRFFYVAKGGIENFDPNFYFIETDLSKEQLEDFLYEKAKEYAKENNVEQGDEQFHDFEVEIGNQLYFFCVGDHLNPLLEAKSPLYEYEEIMSKKINFKILMEAAI